MCKCFYKRSFPKVTVLLGLAFAGFSHLGFSEIPVNGLEDQEVYVNAVTFRIPVEAGFEYEALLNGGPVAPGTPVEVSEPEYYDLSVSRIEKGTGSEETRVIQFIIRASDRGSSETGLARWVPYPAINSALQEFEGAHLDIVAPGRFPSGLEIPVVGLVLNGEGKRVGVNGTVNASGFPDCPMRLLRGVGSVFLPPPSKAGILIYEAEVQSLSCLKEIEIEAGTEWTEVSGTVQGPADWNEDARVHVKDDLKVPEGVELSVGAGSVIKIDPAVDIEVDGKITVNGTKERPVVFTPVDREDPWGGFLLRSGTSRIEMTGAILTGSGADQDWFDHHSGGHSHRHEQCLFFLENGARAGLTDCYVVDQAGQAAHGEDSYLTMTRCLVQRCITVGQFNGGSVNLNQCAFVEFPSAYEPFKDNDSDGLYFTDGTHSLTDCLVGWAFDDGIDHGSGADGVMNVKDCWIESCYHEGFAWSDNGTRRSEDCVVLNCGQGIECGWGDPQVKAVHCFSTANLIGARFGDNYDWSYGGFLEVTDSLLLYNKKDIWGRAWDDWSYHVERMDVNGNYVTRPYELHPGNHIWLGAEHSSLLDAFLPVPDSKVGVGIAKRKDRFAMSELAKGVPVRLSTFTGNTVSVNYTVTSQGAAVDQGKCEFVPGETVKLIKPQISNKAEWGVLRFALNSPVKAAITDTREIYFLQNVELVSTGSVWRFLDAGQTPPGGWREIDFDHSEWKFGPAELGYGDEDEATLVEGGPTDNRYPATYFRKVFEVKKPQRFQSLLLRILRDDGAVVYLNGKEILRSNMPAGEVTSDTWAGGVTDSEDTFRSKEISADLLSTGSNVLAVEVHQANRTSSDISFDMELAGRPAVSRGKAFVRGDCNGDGILDIADAVFILVSLFETQNTECQDAQDVNDDGVLDIADAVYLLNYLFIDGPAIPSPFPAPGYDPTGDDLTCGGG